MQTFSTKSKVRRCLFGPPDHESIRKDLDKALEDNRSELREKWNYDFDQDVPLEGKYQWEVCEEKEYIPSFYTRDYPVKLKRKISDIITVKQTTGSLQSVLSLDSCEDISTCEKSSNSEENCSSQKNVNVCNKPEKKVVQTQISAFMPKRKRSRSDVSLSTIRTKSPRI
ncbi:cyclin-dependent kinase inhibitor 1B-like [Mytilus trossulus]|uniref:cyclin-dependent kinase inhibitor 1B-like n=1 Tax=Mytilus trossulus TaxID=6551 RepID=UPI003003CDBE